MALIVHQIPEGQEDGFIESQRELTRVAMRQPGYRHTHIYMPNPGVHTEWISTIQFETAEQLDAWLASPERKRCLAKLGEKTGEYRVERLGEGFDGWFKAHKNEGSPPGWRMVFTVVLVLFPTVMAITLFLSPFLSSHMSFTMTMLVGNMLSVSFLQWAAMPLATAALGWWLRPCKDCGLGKTLAGVALIAAITAGFVLLFQALQ